MPIYLATDQDETRATTNRVMAAVERWLGWLLWGPRQHDADRCWELGTVPRFSRSESLREAVQPDDRTVQ